MKKILFATLTLIFTQVALGFVNNELNESAEIKIYEGSEVESNCFPSIDKEILVRGLLSLEEKVAQTLLKVRTRKIRVTMEFIPFLMVLRIMALRVIVSL